MPSEWVQKGVDWLRGEDAYLYKQVPPEIGKAHVTTLLGQHPFHPFDPAIADRAHTCFKENATFFQCMSAMPEDMELHMKHVNCYHPYKTDLMKCLVRHRQALRAAAAAAEGAAAAAGESAKAK